MYCIDTRCCDCVVWTNKDIHMQRIYRDSKWCGQQLSKPRKFYFSAMLPELAFPGIRHGGIWEPISSYIENLDSYHSHSFYPLTMMASWKLLFLPFQFIVSPHHCGNMELNSI